MNNVYITRKEIEEYKQKVLEQTVLVRLEDAACMLAVSPKTMLRRVEEHKIPSYTDNSTCKNIRFLASELKQYVKEMRRKYNP